MLRNLVLKLPRCTRDYVIPSAIRKRSFRSLSPTQRVQPSLSERSLSCSRVESTQVSDVPRTAGARTICLSKEYSAQKKGDIKEVQWREQNAISAQQKNEQKEQEEEVEERIEKPTEPLNYESLEQYELEAAKPRPAKSRDVIEAFAAQGNKQFYHLQPNQIKPYGSQENLYSPSLIRPTNLMRYPKKSRKKKKTDEPDATSTRDSPGRRQFSTTSTIRTLSTSKNFVAKAGPNYEDKLSKDTCPHKLREKSESLKFVIDKKLGDKNFEVLKYPRSFREPWAEPKKRLDFAPPTFQPTVNPDILDAPFKFSTAEMRRKRREKENQNGDRHYKSSYSDLVKIKLRELEEERQKLKKEPGPAEHKASTSKVCLGQFSKDLPKTSQILQIAKPTTSEQRSLSTRSKSNILSQDLSRSDNVLKVNETTSAEQRSLSAKSQASFISHLSSDRIFRASPRLASEKKSLGTGPKSDLLSSDLLNSIPKRFPLEQKTLTTRSQTNLASKYLAKSSQIFQLIESLPFEPNFNVRSTSHLVSRYLPKSGQLLQIAKCPPFKNKPLTTGPKSITSKGSSHSRRAFPVPKSAHSKHRLLTTRPKTVSKEAVPTVDATTKSSLLTKKSVHDSLDQRHYSKSKSKGKKPPKKSPKVEEYGYNPECEDICTPIIRAKKLAERAPPTLEPKSCIQEKSRIVYLPSRVKLGVPPCTPRPDHRKCKKDERCPQRADECLVQQPKKLPKIPIGECPCVEPYVPTKAPKLAKLNLKFEDPPKEPCFIPPCTIPRADDQNPYVFKPLKPYVTGDCKCVDPPKMVDVKLKRLPKCETEEICRPPRVCPPPKKCPPRADDCLKLEPKKLPVLEPSVCPCLDPKLPQISPKMKRLNLSVPDPIRECPQPVLCKDKERADDYLRVKKKKLPKFVPGECPCEDKPMIDWNPKRLVCEEEQTDCPVVGPCDHFPRADWGCWEYQQEVCEELDEDCIEKPPPKCPTPPAAVVKSCEKTDTCFKLREIRHIPKRKYSNSTASLTLYNKVKSQNLCLNYGSKIVDSKSNTLQDEIDKITKAKSNLKKSKSYSTINFVKMLGEIDRTKKCAGEINSVLKPTQNDVSYMELLKKIANTTPPVSAKKKRASSLSNPLRSCKSNTLTLGQRNMSTSNVFPQNEDELQQAKSKKSKRICKSLRSCGKTQMGAKKKCPELGKGNEMERKGCKMERIPVCCKKEEAPYPCFTDNLEETITPFTNTPQWTCNRQQYGFHPNVKKEFEPFNKTQKEGNKNFSTMSLISLPNTSLAELPKTKRPATTANTRLMIHTATKPALKASTKAILKKSTLYNVNHVHNRLFATKSYKVQPPVPAKPKGNKKCIGKSYEYVPGQKIKCAPPTCFKDQYKPRWGCKREEIDLDCKRRAPPFPAFSDCLDEEMEDILTECPLDREKYLSMQPKAMNQMKKINLLKPPPPSQGKVDLLKEQECLRQKFCLPKEGLTQSCKDFGKPIPLMKTKKLVKPPTADCHRIEQLKKLGRWPPFIRQKRHICTTSSSLSIKSNVNSAGLNSISDISLNNFGAKRIYVRNYHALVRSTDKAILAENLTKIKELTQTMFPDLDETTKILKLRNNQWKIQCLKNLELLNSQHNVARRAKRYYSTYKTKRKYFLRGQTKGCTFKTHRRISLKAKLLRYKTNGAKGKRSIKNDRSDNSAKKDSRQSYRNKRNRPKFTLNNDGSRVYQGPRQYSPFPTFSDIKKKFLGTTKDDMKTLQPQYNLLQEKHIQKFPEQDKLDMSMSREYYKCKIGLKNEATTLDCESLCFAKKKTESEEGCVKINNTVREPPRACSEKNKPAKKISVVEFFVQTHKQKKAGKKNVKTCQKIEDECEEDRKKIGDICIEHCIKSIPCHLPEEEKSCICRRACESLYKRNDDANDVKLEYEQEAKCKDEIEEELKIEEEYKLEEKPKKQNSCEIDLTPVKYQKEITPSITKVCATPAETIQVNIVRPKKPKPACCIKSSSTNTKPCPGNSKPCSADAKPCASKPKPCTSKPKPCSNKITTSTSSAMICPAPLPCPPKRSKSLAYLENIWQRIVNYFKARPNCPEPGEWKKQALKAKAEKAAKAAGLVVLNPKCLPPEILRSAKVLKSECKVCPNTDPIDKRDDGESNKSAASVLSRRNFSTIVQQPTRNFSKSISCQDLREINKLLEENETRGEESRRNCRQYKKEFAPFSEREDPEACEAVKLSLEKEVYRDIDFKHLCYKEEPYAGTYFGYSNVIPSRENILERAWRVSIESSYNKIHHPKAYNFFNEFFNKMENSIQSVEDLEKLKTENVLRELDEYLKKHDSDKNKK